LKKTIYYLIVAMAVFIPVIAKAEVGDYNHNVDMTQEEYNHLLQLGFTEQEVYFMGENEFEENKHLEGEVVGETTQYYMSTINHVTGESRSYIIDESGYNIPLVMQRGNGYVETVYKKMTTTISSINTYYRYKVTLEWKQMPATRSWDIIAIAMEPTKVYMRSSITFQQNYCLTTGACYSSLSHQPSSQTYGGGASFPIPTGNLKSLSSYLYFNVDKSTSATITRLFAQGDYAHATSTVSQSSISYTLSAGGIHLNSNIISKYDTMQFAEASWYGTW